MMGNMYARGWYGGDWNSAPDFMKNIMQQYWGGIGPFLGIAGLLDVVKEFLVVILLVAAIRWLWMKGNEKGK